MGKRIEVLWRVLALIWAFTAGWLVMLVSVPIGLVFGIVDALWQLIFGSEGLSDSNIGFRIYRGVLMWVQGLMMFGVTGSGSFQWLPDI